MLYFTLDTLSYMLSSSNYLVFSIKNIDVGNAAGQVFLLTYYLNLHTLLAAYSILYLKSSQDIINDVSKLEDMGRVSQFQKVTALHSYLRQSQSNSQCQQQYHRMSELLVDDNLVRPRKGSDK